jgi:double-stranded uracil-DNA glycosylase
VTGPPADGASEQASPVVGAGPVSSRVVLDDVLAPGLSVVFCGTAASSRSAAVMQYYAGRGNKFWRILCAVGLTPRLLAPAEYWLLPEFGIGLTDIVKEQSGADRDIVFHGNGALRLREKVVHFQPRFLAFNGKRAAREFLGQADIDYGPCAERIGSTALHVLPSTAGLASGFWDERPWYALAGLVNAVARSQTHPADRPGG